MSEAMLRGEFKNKNLIKIDVLDEEHLKIEGVKDESKEEEKAEKAIVQPQ